MNNTEYYSAIKKNEIMLLAGKWIELVINMLGEISNLKNLKWRLEIHVYHPMPTLTQNGSRILISDHKL
jgi:hypothetical protein